MSGIQVANGKGFEYACAVAIREVVGANSAIIPSDPLTTAKKAFESLSPSEQQNFKLAAEAGVKQLLLYEPLLNHPIGLEPLEISLQPDHCGKMGDVRDVLCSRKSNGKRWEIGISCKHNSDDVKHSRLSQTIDFGEEWLGLKCDAKYFNAIAPIFQLLNANKGKPWAIIGDEAYKASHIYKPVLDAFREEFLRLYENNEVEVSQALCRYLIGRQDFYKFIAKDDQKSTLFQAFNINGTLNRKAGKTSANQKVQPLRLPTKVYEVRFAKYKNGTEKENTLEVECDNGWAISMRIHNAKGKIETSLKFAIHLVGPNFVNQTALW